MKRASCFGTLFAVAPLQAQDPGPAVTIDSGTLRGTILGNIAAFKGIPFAAPPTGPLRWRPPQPVPPWDGERDATRFGSICPQSNFPGGAGIVGLPRSEDCLFLNVWTPIESLDMQRQLPVLVSIHGGGMVNGSGRLPVFDGTALARRGLIVVTFNYRLGRLGLFRHPVLAAEASKAGEATGNYAFMDQIAALEWVQHNIAHFGGDPAKVTIVGESAGGVSVLALMTTPKAKGLFSAAIAQSPVPRFDFVSEADAEQAGTAFATAAGVAAADTDADTLRAIPVDTLLKGAEFFRQDRATYSGPMVDGTLITDSILPAFSAGRQARVPLIIGATGRELGAVPPSAIAAMVDQLPSGTQALAETVYNAEGMRSDYVAGVELLSDCAFVEPVRAVGRHAATAGQPTWVYCFDYVAEHLRSTIAGATHASDVAYSFGTLGAVDPEANAADRQMADIVADYWANFVKAHDPNGPALPSWPRAGTTGDPILTFENDRIFAGPDTRRARLDAVEVSATT